MNIGSKSRTEPSAESLFTRIKNENAFLNGKAHETHITEKFTSSKVGIYCLISDSVCETYFRESVYHPASTARSAVDLESPLRVA